MPMPFEEPHQHGIGVGEIRVLALERYAHFSLWNRLLRKRQTIIITVSSRSRGSLLLLSRTDRTKLGSSAGRRCRWAKWYVNSLPK